MDTNDFWVWSYVIKLSVYKCHMKESVVKKKKEASVTTAIFLKYPLSFFMVLAKEKLISPG